MTAGRSLAAAQTIPRRRDVGDLDHGVAVALDEAGPGRR
jgi:hypothetical protein